MLEHGSEFFLPLEGLVEGRTSNISTLAQLLCTSCARTAAVLLFELHLHHNETLPQIYRRLIGALFSCGAPANTTCLLVLELAVWEQLDPASW